MKFKPMVIFRRFKSTKIGNLLELEGKLDISEYEIDPVFYMTIFKDFERKNPEARMTFQFSPFELLSFGEEILTLLENSDEVADRSFRFYSGGKDNGKWIVLQRGKGKDGAGGDLFLNFEEKGRKIPISFSVEQGRALSFIFRDAVTEMYGKADESLIKKERSRFINSKKKKKGERK